MAFVHSELGPTDPAPPLAPVSVRRLHGRPDVVPKETKGPGAPVQSRRIDR